jgi:hypothetical protein
MKTSLFLATIATLGLSNDPLTIGELKYGYKLDPERDTIVGQLNDETKKIELFDAVHVYDHTFYEQGSCYLVVTKDELADRFADSRRSTPRTDASHVLLTVKTKDKEGNVINKRIEALNNGQIIRDVAGRELGDGRKFRKDDSAYGGWYQSKDGEGFVKIEPLYL